MVICLVLLLGVLVYGCWYYYCYNGGTEVREGRAANLAGQSLWVVGSGVSHMIVPTQILSSLAQHRNLAILPSYTPSPPAAITSMQEESTKALLGLTVHIKFHSVQFSQFQHFLALPQVLIRHRGYSNQCLQQFPCNNNS